MADYWGMKAIGQRMGVCDATIRAWHRSPSGFLMYLRYRPGLRVNRKPAWYTNDALILSWEISRCLYDKTSPLSQTIGRKRQPNV